MADAVIQRGRFELVEGYARSEWLRHGGLALVMLVFGVGMAVYGAYVTQELLEVGRVWRDGVASSEPADYGGDVVTHYGMLKRYDLRVTYLPDDSEEPITFEAEFHRFFSGPDEGEEMTVKHLGARAVCSWQHDALTHGWIWAAIVWALAACGVFTFAVVTRDLVRTVAKVKELAQEGQLMRAKVEEAKPGGTDKMPLLILRYRTARGELQKQTFFVERGGPFLVDDGATVVVLSSVNERTSYALREDGYPLAVKPEV